MFGPEILARTLSKATRIDKSGRAWQYHSRSDHHSKVACWGIVFDLLRSCPTLRRHVVEDRVRFGINHEMRDFVQDRKKNLDLVLCTPSGANVRGEGSTLASLVETYEIELPDAAKTELSLMEPLRRAPVGSVLVALEAKACMTAHQRALPRLYDELNSSHQTVHASSDQAIAAGFVMINAAERYLSPDLNKGSPADPLVWSMHVQPRDALLAVEKVRQLPKRARTNEAGYDALAITVVDFANDGSTVRMVDTEPAPKAGEIYHYAAMIDRLSHTYATRFRDL